MAHIYFSVKRVHVDLFPVDLLLMKIYDWESIDFRDPCQYIIYFIKNIPLLYPLIIRDYFL